MGIDECFFYIAVFFYALLFLLFIRFFIWKRYAFKHYWSKKESISLNYLNYVAKHKELPLPFISILIPAKDEAQVIESTLQNILKLDYPRDSFEVIVITDEKEEIKQRETFKNLLEELTHYEKKLKKDLSHEAVVLLSLINLNNTQNGEFYYKVYQEINRYTEEFKAEETLNKIDTIARSILKRSFYSKRSLYLEGIFAIRNAFPFLKGNEISHLSEIYAEYLNILKNLELDSFKELSIDLLDFLLPSTKSISIKFANKYSASGYNIKVCDVPINFSGEFPGSFLNCEVKSTKGRALNYGLKFINGESRVIGFYDAESRPSKEVLLYVAERYLEEEENMPILQGPLFQVRNFYNMGLISRLGGLFKAISHDWYLPIIFKTIPFAGGTNLFVLKETLHKISGFDPASLTEDLDLGIRSYLICGKGVEFLPVISTEQTPPLLKGYFNQRLRWAYGHLDVMSKLKKWSRLYFELFIKGPLEWIIYQFSGFIVASMNVIFILSKLNIISTTTVMHSNYFNLAFTLLNIPYLLFSIYCYNRYEFTFDKNFKPLNELPGFEIFKLMISSLFVFLLPLPYTWAVVLKLSGKKLNKWVKTERSTE